MPFPPSGDLPNPEIEPESLVSPALVVDLFSLAPLTKPYFIKKKKKYLLRTKRGARASQMVLVVKNLLGDAGDIRNMALIPASGRFPGGGHGNPLQDSCLENPMDRGAWWATVHRLAMSQTLLSD